MRVRPDIKLEDLFQTICKEANLDKNRYDLLVLNNCIRSTAFEDPLSAYDTKEVTLALKSFIKHTDSKFICFVSIMHAFSSSYVFVVLISFFNFFYLLKKIKIQVKKHLHVFELTSRTNQDLKSI